MSRRTAIVDVAEKISVIMCDIVQVTSCKKAPRDVRGRGPPPRGRPHDLYYTTVAEQKVPRVRSHKHAAYVIHEWFIEERRRPVDWRKQCFVRLTDTGGN